MMIKKLYLLYFPGFFDGDELIGIYDDIIELKKVYEDVLEDKDGEYEFYLNDSHTSLTITEFDRKTRKFIKVDPKELWKDIPDLKTFKKVEYIIDNNWQYMFYRENAFVTNNGICFFGLPADIPDCLGAWKFYNSEFKLDMYFQADSYADVIKKMGQWWGGWNKCPSSEYMADKIRDWEERYGAKLVEIAHDYMSFKCEKKFDEKEAERFLEELDALPSNALDLADYEVLKKRLIETGYFEIWWD